MKYLFIINPVAGKTNALEVYGDKIEKTCREKGLDFDIVQTEYAGHATSIAAAAAEAATADDPVRIFSVGGDGTLSEIVKGIICRENCEIGCIPAGTGNDYIKTFGDAEEFLDFDAYFESASLAVDAIKAEDAYSINICSLGLDAMICDRANKIKARSKKLSDSRIYDKAVARCILGRIYNKLKITIDDVQVYSGKYVFSLAASGQYYGGGFHSAPMAVPSDGLLDFILMKNMSHLRVPFVIGDYKAGTYMSKRKFKKLVTHVRGRKMRIESAKPAVLNIDGECRKIKDITLEIVPGALRFIVPRSYAEILDIRAFALSQEALA